MILPLVIVVAALASACAGPLPNTYASPEDLARAVLSAIERRDLDALHQLALNREEFVEYVWPELPAARPERNLTAAYVWGDLNQKSNLTLRKTLAAHGGKKYQLVSLRYLGDATAYDSFIVNREAELTITDQDGQKKEIRLFGSVIQRDGWYKVFSYVVDD